MAAAGLTNPPTQQKTVSIPPPLPDETDVCSGIEDEGFRRYCLENFDTDKDGKISRQEAELVKELNGAEDFDFYFTSTKGIEYFTNLETFSCTGSGVETIDLHYNTKITTIQSEAFAFCHELTKFVLPPNVTSIEEYAFEDDEKLAGFYGNLASENNRFLILDGKLVGFASAGLTVCSIPEGVKEIGTGTIRYYEYESELAELRIPDSVTSVAEGAISKLPNLKAIYGRFATDDNRCLIMDDKLLAFAPVGLTAYSIPNGVKTIGEYVFSSYGLTDITIPDGVETIGDGAFKSSGLTSVNIPDGVKAIGDNAFTGCRLTTVTIPKSVTSIGYWAFDCAESVTVEATTPPALERFAFGDVEYNGHRVVINVPKAAVDAYRTADGWEYYAEYIKGI